MQKPGPLLETLLETRVQRKLGKLDAAQRDNLVKGVLAADAKPSICFLCHCFSIAFRLRNALHAPRVRRVIYAVHGFALDDVDANGVFVIDMLVEG